MWHIAPIDCIIAVAVGSICIAEDEAKHVSSINHSSEVIDPRVVRRIPRAIEGSAVLLRAWNLAVWPNEWNVIQIRSRPESDEKKKSRGVGARHGPYVVEVRVSSRNFLSKEGSSNATAD